VDVELRVIETVARSDMSRIGSGPGDPEPRKRGRHPQGFGPGTAGRTPGQVGPIGVHDADQAEELPVHRPLPARVAIRADDHAARASGPHESVVGSENLPGTERYPPSPELDRSVHAEARRGRKRRARGDRLLEIAAHGVG
jgi:hypothetical protein